MNVLVAEAHFEESPLVNPPRIIGKILKEMGHTVTFLGIENLRSRSRFTNLLLSLLPKCNTIDGIEYCSSPYVRLPFGIEYISSTLFATVFATLHYRRRKFDVVFSGDCGHTGVVASVVGRLHHCPVIADFADPYWWHLKDPFVRTIPYRIDRFFERINLRRKRIKHVFVNDVPIGDYVKKSYPNQKVHLCPLGYFRDEVIEGETARREIVRKELGLPSGRIILYSGSLGKAQFMSDVLLGAAKLILERTNDALFIVSGRPYDRETATELRRLQLSFKSFRFLGWLPRPTYRRLLGIADVCVSARDSDIITSKVVEYMNAGKPVVLADLGWSRRDGLVKNGYNCVRTPPDATSLADGILRLLENDELARNIAVKGKGTFAPYSWERIAILHAEAAESEIRNLSLLNESDDVQA